jgi:hypothetical protein
MASWLCVAGVGDHIMCAQRSWEPEKPCSMLRMVNGGGVSRGTTGGHSLGAAGWRIGA